MELGELVDDPTGVSVPVADAGAGAEHDRLGDAGHHVCEGQELVERVGLVDLERVDVHARRVEQVGVAEHAALGRAGGPGGVDERGQVIAIKAGQRGR